MEKTTIRKFLLIASFMMVINIMIGAFGAHGLKPYLDDYGTIIYNKAVDYSFYNTLGLFVISFIATQIKDIKQIAIGYYILSLTRIFWLGAITPIGGTLMIIGWMFVFFGIYKNLK